MEGWDEEKDEDCVGHLDHVRKELNFASDPGFHSAGLEGPGGTLGKEKVPKLVRS